MTRGFIALAVALFAATFAYLMTRTGPTSVGPDGGTAISVSAAEMRTASLLFSSTAWSICVAMGSRVLASSSTAATRALIGILGPVGMAVAFAVPVVWTAGMESLAIPIVIAGMALVVVSRVLTFAFFGAKEAFEEVGRGIGALREQLGGGSAPPQDPPQDPPPVRAQGPVTARAPI